MKAGTAVIWGVSLVVTAGLGFVVGLSMTESLPQEPDGVTPMRTNVDPAPATDEGASIGTRETRRPAERVERTSAAPVPALDLDLPPPRADGVVVGRCLDVHGNPVEGVVVELIPNARQALPPLAADADLETRIAHMATSMRWVDRGTQRAVSEADGSVRFDSLTDARYRLSVKWTAHWPASRHNEELAPGDEFEASGRPAGRLVFDVTTADGKPATSGMVQVGPGVRVSWNPTAPFVLAAPGLHDITLVVGDAAHTWKAVEVGLDEPVRLSGTLESAGGIAATVRRDGVEEGSVRYHVRAARLADGVEPDSTLLEVQGAKRAESDAEGGYRFFPLEPGRWLVGVRAGRSREYDVLQVVEVSNAVTNCELVLAAPEATANLAVHVLDPDGVHVRDAQVWMNARANRRTIRSNGQVLTREDGARTIPWPDVEPDAEAVYTLEVWHQLWGRVRTTVDRASLEHTIQLVAPAKPRVRIAGYVGSPVQGRILVTSERIVGDRTVFGGQADPDDEGHCVLPPLQPGRVRIFVNVLLGGQARTPVGYREFDLSAGESSVTVDLPALYSTTLLVPESSKGHRAQVWRTPANREDPLQVRADGVVTSDGKLELEFLPAGEYQVRLRGRRQALTITLPGPVEVDLRED